MSLSSPARRAVFLDRDGVINRMVFDPEFGLVDSPQNADQFQLLPGVARAIGSVNEAGFLAVVVSNQPGIAKGKCTHTALQSIGEKMHRQLSDGGARLDAVYYCLHHPEGVLDEYRVHCGCRKPKPGLLKKAATELGIDLNASYMIGDGLTDVLAGKAAGCTTILLSDLKCDICAMMHKLDARPDLQAQDLPEAIGLICGNPGLASAGTALNAQSLT